MSLSSIPHRFTTSPRYVAPIIIVAILLGGFIGWHEWQAAPVRQHIETGIRLLQTGENVAAEDEWRKALSLDPRNVQAWMLLGDYYMAAKAWPAATDAWHHVLELDPSTPNLHTRLATCAMSMQNYKDAQQQAQAELTQDPNSVVALKVLAIAAKKKGQDEEQLKYLRRLADLQPDDVEVLGTLANELTERNEFDQARPIIERILQLNPDYLLAYMLRGVAYFTQDPTPVGLTHAEADFRKVLQLNPQDVEAHRYLGRVYMRLNQPQRAIEQFEALSQGRPYASAHFLELANAYRKVGKAQQAGALQRRFVALKQLNVRMQDLKDRVTREPQNFDYNLQLGLLLLHCVESTADNYHLYHFRYIQQKIKAPEFYLGQALAQRPHDTRAQAAMHQLETAYVRHLQAGLAALKRHNLAAANWDLAHAVVLRPADPRTKQAGQQAALAGASTTDNTTVVSDASAAGAMGGLATVQNDLMSPLIANARSSPTITNRFGDNTAVPGSSSQ